MLLSAAPYPNPSQMKNSSITHLIATWAHSLAVLASLSSLYSCFLSILFVATRLLHLVHCYPVIDQSMRNTLRILRGRKFFLAFYPLTSLFVVMMGICNLNSLFFVMLLLGFYSLATRLMGSCNLGFGYTMQVCLLAPIFYLRA